MIMHNIIIDKYKLILKVSSVFVATHSICFSLIIIIIVHQYKTIIFYLYLSIMICIHIKPSSVIAQNWYIAYQQIEKIVDQFPLPLLRVESYNGYEKNLDKDHLNLKNNVGTELEHIAFYGDFMSLTNGNQIRFYKNWDVHCKLTLSGEIIDEQNLLPGIPISHIITMGIAQMPMD